MNSLCAEIEQRLASGQVLTPAQHAHAAGCALCAPLLRRFALAEQLLAAPSSAPPWLAEKTLARIRRRRLAKAFLHESFPWKWVALGTAFGVAVMTFWVLVGVPPRQALRLPTNWDFTEQYLALLTQWFRTLLVPLVAVALSILPFLVPAPRGQAV
jgi:hypothetical protein